MATTLLSGRYGSAFFRASRHWCLTIIAINVVGDPPGATFSNPAAAKMTKLLEIRDFGARIFFTRDGVAKASKRVSLSWSGAQYWALVGESGLWQICSPFSILVW